MREQHKHAIKVFLTRGVLIAALLFAFSYIEGFKEPLARASAFVSAPFWIGYQYALDKTSTVKNIFTEKKKLTEENETLRRMLKVARVYLIQSSVLQKENTELKTLLLRHEKSGGVLGAVLSKPYYSPYDTFVIDIGAVDGIEVGNIVLSGESLLGIIDAIYKKTAKVKLFSSPRTEIEVIIGEEHIPALAHGLGGGSFQIKLPHDIVVREGDAVFYPSLENFLIGVVEVVKSKQANPLQTILFQVPLNIWETRFVTVLPQFLFSLEGSPVDQ